MRLLIVEDDAMLADGLARSLRQSGYAVDWVDSAERAQLAVEHETFDLVVLDVGLPGIDGFELLRRLRKAEQYVPVIVVTARDAVTDRVRGLDLGADDYLVKPFAFEELEARVRALIRRGRTPTTPRLVYGPLVLDLVARDARVAGEPLELTAREWALMELFVTQPGVALSKERIVQSLSSWDEKLSHNAIEVYVSRLRAKLEPAGVSIRTVRGFGYLLETPREG
ncbi:MAG TPA: response regulator transcription factor [Burkholderiales bacterium]|nr:response regulator transcription factor [Burkholderiales bacterium]